MSLSRCNECIYSIGQTRRSLLVVCRHLETSPRISRGIRRASVASAARALSIRRDESIASLLAEITRAPPVPGHALLTRLTPITFLLIFRLRKSRYPRVIPHTFRKERPAGYSEHRNSLFPRALLPLESAAATGRVDRWSVERVERTSSGSPGWYSQASIPAAGQLVHRSLVPRTNVPSGGMPDICVHPVNLSCSSCAIPPPTPTPPPPSSPSLVIIKHRSR